MATGGFKAFEVNYTGNGNTSVANAQAACQQIIGAVCAGLIQTLGWEYDTDFTADASSFTKIGTNTSNRESQAYCQFLKNQSGTKLCIAYFVGTGSGNPLASASLWSNSYTTGASNVKGTGLALSMIPPDINNTWDTSESCTTNGFLPGEAIPFVSAACTISNSTSCVSNNTNNRTYHYVFFGKDDLILWSCKAKGVGTCPCWATIGRIFGQLCNNTDNDACSHYGGMTLYPDGYTTTEYDGSSGGMISRSSGLFWGFGMYCTFFAARERPAVKWVSNRTGRLIYTNSATIDVSTVTSPLNTGATAFGAMLFGIDSSNPIYQGVVPGNGWKGYLDTDAFRTIYEAFPLGTTFDDGNFIHIGCGWAVGWDKANTVNPWL